MDTVLYTGNTINVIEFYANASHLLAQAFYSERDNAYRGMPLIPDFKPAERLKQIKPSGIRRFFAIAQKMPGVVNLTVGEPDFAPPEQALEAGWQAAKKGKTHYPPTNGIPELREALADKVRRDYGLKYDPDTEVLITVGGTESIFLALFSLINPGDEVLLPNPGFVCYEPSVLLAGGVSVYVPLIERNQFKPSLDLVTSLITDRSRVMILNHPNNPTGSVLSYDEAAALSKVAVERDMIVISDEVYEKIIYDGAEHQCMATFPRMRERTLIVNSFSKTYAMTGLRVGYVCGPEKLISALWLAHQFTVACVNSPAQYAALAALKGAQDFIKDMVREFDRRRHLVHERFNEIRSFGCSLPKGAFYVFPSVRDFGMPSEKFAQFLAKESRVATVPGTAFGSYGEGYIRVSYAAAYEQLEKAMNRIEKAVKKLK